MTTEPVIQVQGLSKSFAGKQIVSELDLNIYPGEIFGMLGPNGSGKTTSLRLLCGLLTPDAGDGVCLGYPLSAQQKIRESVGYMTQRFSLYEDLSVLENLNFFKHLYPNSLSQDLTYILDSFKLGPFAHKLAGHLSGGWKQRLALACSMLQRPKLLLLDEPTAGVDPRARREFWSKIHELSQEGVTILVSTHYMDEAIRCHRLAYLVSGRIRAHGRAEEMIKQSGLHTWKVSGKHLQALQMSLLKQPEILQCTFYGNDLHVVGRQAKQVVAILDQHVQDASCYHPIATDLEAVFIALSEQSTC